MDNRSAQSFASLANSERSLGVRPIAMGQRSVRGPAGWPLKRSFDFVVAALMILALSPLLVGVALMVRVTSPGPVLYGHIRVGLNGQYFRCWKFRSMVPDADTALARYLSRSPDARREWAGSRKLRHDPRITAVGAVLRSLSIDELPQLFNVLAGEMSLVGPRPVVPDELSRYGRSARHYLRVRPGITGLWQVSGRSKTSYARRIALDRFYVARCSGQLDMMILARTIPVVLRSGGAW